MKPDDVCLHVTFDRHVPIDHFECLHDGAVMVRDMVVIWPQSDALSMLRALRSGQPCAYGCPDSGHFVAHIIDAKIL